MINQLDQIEQKIYMGSLSKKMKDHNRKELIDLSIELITGVIGYCGYKMGEVDQDILNKLLIHELGNRRKGMTVKAVKIGFDEGMREVWGEYFGISMKSFNQWLDHIERIQLNVNKQKILEEKQGPKKALPEKPLTDIEVSKDWWDKLVEYIEEYLELPHGWPYNECFLYLKEEGLLKFDEKEYKKIAEIMIEKEAEKKGQEEKYFRLKEYIERMSEPDEMTKRIWYQVVKDYTKTKFKLD